MFPPGYSSANSLFEFYLLGPGEYTQGKRGPDEQRQVNFIDNLSVIKAGHQLKFGVDYRWLAPFTSPFSYSQFVLFSGVNAAQEEFFRARLRSRKWTTTKAADCDRATFPCMHRTPGRSHRDSL
jgi:hypothetical protein